MLQLPWASMTWRQKIQLEVSVWAWTKWLDQRLRAASVPSWLIHSGNWWSLAIVGSRELELLFLNDRCTLQLQLAASRPSSLVLLDLKLQLLGKRRCDINSSLQGFSKESLFFSLFAVVFRHAVSPCLSQRQVCPRLRFMISYWYLFIVMNANRQ